MNIGGNDVAYTFTDKGIRLYQPSKWVERACATSRTTTPPCS